jgi:hypothetical protein
MLKLNECQLGDISFNPSVGYAPVFESGTSYEYAKDSDGKNFDYSKYKGNSREDYIRIAKELGFDYDATVRTVYDKDYSGECSNTAEGTILVKRWLREDIRAYGYAKKALFSNKTDIYLSAWAASDKFKFRTYAVYGHELTHAYNNYHYGLAMGERLSEASAYQVEKKIIAANANWVSRAEYLTFLGLLNYTVTKEHYEFNSINNSCLPLRYR